MRFAAEGLPAGLEIHPETGLITGKLNQGAGTFEVVLQAKNVERNGRKKNFILSVVTELLLLRRWDGTVGTASTRGLG